MFEEKIRFLPDPEGETKMIYHNVASFDYANLYPNVMRKIDIKSIIRRAKIRNILKKINPS